MKSLMKIALLNIVLIGSCAQVAGANFLSLLGSEFSPKNWMLAVNIGGQKYSGGIWQQHGMYVQFISGEEQWSQGGWGSILHPTEYWEYDVNYARTVGNSHKEFEIKPKISPDHNVNSQTASGYLTIVNTGYTVSITLSVAAGSVKILNGTGNSIKLNPGDGTIIQYSNEPNWKIIGVVRQADTPTPGLLKRAPGK